MSFVIGLLALVLLMAERAGVIFVAIGVAGDVTAIWQGSEAWRKSGLQEDANGITNRRFAGYMHWPWAGIEKVVHVRSRVYVILRTGQAVPLIGIAQGYRTTWCGDATRDIAGVLNDRLALWRAEHLEPALASNEEQSAPARIR